MEILYRLVYVYARRYSFLRNVFPGYWNSRYLNITMHTDIHDDICVGTEALLKLNLRSSLLLSVPLISTSNVSQKWMFNLKYIFSNNFQKNINFFNSKYRFTWYIVLQTVHSRVYFLKQYSKKRMCQLVM